MAKYFFCDNFQQKSVIVLANFGSCSAYREYNDGTCLYQTYSRTITFTISDVHPPLNLRFRYWQEYYQDNVLTWSGWIDAVVPIPADVLTYDYVQDCHEKRYCNFTNGNQGDYPIQNMQN